MLKKLVSAGLLAASLMSVSGVVGASNVDNTQDDYYTAGYVNVKNLINGYQNGSVVYPQDPALTGTLNYYGYDSYTSNYQDLYGSNWVSTANKIKGENNNVNRQTNDTHIGGLSLKNKISGENNQSNDMYANGYSDSQVKNNITGYSNSGNTQNVGWSGYNYYGDGVFTGAKSKNSIQSDYLEVPLLTLDGPVYSYAGNYDNEQTTYAETDANIENNIGKAHSYYDYDSYGNLVEYTYVDGIENSNNYQSVSTAETLANSKNKINGSSNDVNDQYADSWADQNAKNHIYGIFNASNFQEIGSDLSSKNKNEINGLGNSFNVQDGYTEAEQYLDNKVDGDFNNYNSQEAYSDTSSAGKNKINGTGNTNNYQNSDSRAYTDVSNKVSGYSNNGNRQYSDSSNNVKSTNSIESWDNVGTIE